MNFTAGPHLLHDALCLRLLSGATWRETFSFYFSTSHFLAHSWVHGLGVWWSRGMLILYTAQLLLLPTMTRTNFSYSKLPEESAPEANISLSCYSSKREVSGWMTKALAIGAAARGAVWKLYLLVSEPSF